MNQQNWHSHLSYVNGAINLVSEDDLDLVPKQEVLKLNLGYCIEHLKQSMGQAQVDTTSPPDEREYAVVKHGNEPRTEECKATMQEDDTPTGSEGLSDLPSTIHYPRRHRLLSSDSPGGAGRRS